MKRPLDLYTLTSVAELLKTLADNALEGARGTADAVKAAQRDQSLTSQQTSDAIATVGHARGLSAAADVLQLLVEREALRRMRGQVAS